MRRRLFILVFAILAVLTSCERRELEYGNAIVDLRLNINLNIRVNGKFERLPDPEMMRVMFFDPTTYDFVTETYLPAKGGRVSIAPGHYKFIAYNFDTEATLVRNDMNYKTIEAYTNEVSSALKSNMLNALRYGKLASTKADTDLEADPDDVWTMAIKKVQESAVIYEPDHLFVSHQDVEVKNISGTQTIEAEAESVVETWQISVRIKNEQYMASARALLTGQIASNFIGKEKEEGKTDTDVTLMFDMKAGSDSETNDIVVGTFNTFGKNPSVESRLLLTIIIKTVGGETVSWTRDITDEFMSEENIADQTIDIVDETIIIDPPDNPTGNGGFQPGVDDWDIENIPIDI